MDARWEKTRRLVLARDGNLCLRCLEQAQHVHHRLLKGQGGTSDAIIKYGLANLVSVCFSCHSFVHLHPLAGYETGFLVHSWDDPENVPLKTGSYSALVMLTPEGDIRRTGGLLF
jgi:5-methylcytosine-specific restriction enzyme A